MRTSVVVVLASTMLIGCGDSVGEEGEVEGVGYVLLDLEARDAGFAVDGLSSADAMLPLEFDAGDTIDLIGPDKTVPIEIYNDELVWIRGEEGIIEQRALDIDVSRDVIFVAGDENAAKKIANQVRGIYEVEEDGLWRVQGSDVISSAAQSYTPDGLDEVLPAVSPELVEMQGNEHADASTRRQLLDVVPPKRLMSFDVMENLPIHELLTPPIACSDPVEGIWVSREYYPAYDDWYVFTLEVKRHAEDPTQLNGRIRARIWSGDIAVESPVACDLHPPARWAPSFDFTVGMKAEGTIHDGQVSFGGATTWRTTSRRCGPQHQWFGYNLDRFSGSVTEDGRWLQSVNNDGGRSVDDPHNFRRVSCL